MKLLSAVLFLLALAPGAAFPSDKPGARLPRISEFTVPCFTSIEKGADGTTLNFWDGTILRYREIEGAFHLVYEDHFERESQFSLKVLPKALTQSGQIVREGSRHEVTPLVALMIKRAIEHRCGLQPSMRLQISAFKGEEPPHFTGDFDDFFSEDFRAELEWMFDVLGQEIFGRGMGEFYDKLKDPPFVPRCQVVVERCIEACDDLKELGYIVCSALGQSVSPYGHIVGALCSMKILHAARECRQGCRYPNVECTR